MRSRRLEFCKNLDCKEERQKLRDEVSEARLSRAVIAGPLRLAATREDDGRIGGKGWRAAGPRCASHAKAGISSQSGIYVARGITPAKNS